LAGIHYPVVNNSGCVKVLTNFYWAPVPVGVAVEVKVYAAYVEIWHEGKRVAPHERCFGRQEKVLNLEHYLSIRQIHSALQEIQTFTGGRLARRKVFQQRPTGIHVPGRLDSEAVGCTVSVCRKLKTEVPAHSQSGGQTRMDILVWIILGLVAGFIGSKIVNKSGEGFSLDIILGIVGAVVGGWLFSYFGAHGVTGLNIYSLVMAVLGAIVVVVVYHAIRRVG
jgi:uncharacterized membrane protein YeaQ/YmgE (transglycosylase-associated protein family)/uncharacterized protein YjhX (UPF0386 family)